MRVGRRQFLASGALALGLGISGAGARLLAHEPSARKPTIARGYTSCRYGQLHYLKGAPADGQERFPPLILLHQTPSSSLEYKNLVAEMARDREVIAFDTPGSGMSDWPSGPMEMSGYALAFADGIEAMGLSAAGPVDVFGYHTGTLLAAELGIARPRNVGRLVMSGIPYRSREERLTRIADIENGPKLTEEGDELLAHQRNLWNYVVKRRDKSIPLRRAAELYMDKAKPMDRYWWSYRGVWTYEVEERFPLITQPLLVIQPHELLLQSSRDAAALVSDARVVELPELSTDVFEIGIEQFARELRNFLV